MIEKIQESFIYDRRLLENDREVLEKFINHFSDDNTGRFIIKSNIVPKFSDYEFLPYEIITGSLSFSEVNYNLPVLICNNITLFPNELICLTDEDYDIIYHEGSIKQVDNGRLYVTF